MGCRGCGKRAKKFKERRMKEEKAKKKDPKELAKEPEFIAKKDAVRKAESERRAKEHFMKVCKHGVPHGKECKSCKKVISIPEDAVIKPDGWEPVKEKAK